MPGPTFKIQSPGLGEGGYVGVTIDDTDLQTFVRQYREEARRNLNIAMQKALRLTQVTLIKKLAPSEYTGDLIRDVFDSSNAKILPGATVSPLQGITAVIGSDLPQAGIVEFGRRAGQRPPPSDVMETWARVKIGEEHLGYIIARSIGRKGIKGQYPFQKTAIEVAPAIERFFNEAVETTLSSH